MTRILLFTDGTATSVNNYSGFNGAFGYVAYELRGDDDIPPILKGGGYREDTTVPRCELSGIKYGLIACHNHSELFTDTISDILVVTDSQLSRDTLLLWLPGWIRNGKKRGTDDLVNGSGNVAKNQDVIKDIHKLMSFPDVKVSIHHINSHLDTPDKIEKAYKRYNRFNNTTIDLNLFLRFVHANTLVDHNIKCYYDKKLERDTVYPIKREG